MKHRKIAGWIGAALCCLLLGSCGQPAATWQEQYDLGVKYLSDGNYEEAIIAFTAAIEIDPKRAPAYVGRGNAYLGLGETEETLAAAQADYEMSIELDAASAEAYLGLADIYMALDNVDAAKAILQQGYEATGNEILNERLMTLPLLAPDEVVVWTDPTLEQMVRSELGILDGPVYVQDLNYITKLVILGNTHIFINRANDGDWRYCCISRKAGEEILPSFYLSAFYAVKENADQGEHVEYTQRGTIGNIETLQYFQNLRSIVIIANHVTDISILAKLPNIKSAIFFANDIIDTSLLDQLYAEQSNLPPQEQFLEIGSPVSKPD